MKDLRVAFVGTSSIMELIIAAAKGCEGLLPRVVYSRSAERGQAFAEKMGLPEACCDYEAMVKRADLDLVYIASPNFLHFSQALLALEHKKHVILEKPAVLSRQEAQRLYAAARENGVFYFEAISTLFLPCYEFLRSRLPEIGKITEASISYGQYSSKYAAYLRGENPNIFNPAMKAGALNDMGIYGVHVAVDLLGAPKKVRYKAQRGENGIDLRGVLTLDYGDFLCTVETAKDHDLENGFSLRGERGELKATGPLNSLPKGTLLTEGQAHPAPENRESNRLSYELRRFCDAILEKDEAFFSRMSRQSEEAAAILQAAAM